MNNKKLELIYEQMLGEELRLRGTKGVNPNFSTMGFAQQAGSSKPNPNQKTTLDADEIAQKASGMVNAINAQAAQKQDEPTTEDEVDLLALAKMETDAEDEGEPILPYVTVSKGGEERKYNLVQYGYKMFSHRLNRAYKNKEPLLVYGDPGLGKTNGVINFAHSVADQKKKKLLIWWDASPEEQQNAIKNPTEYFLLVLVTTAELEPTDILGVPDMGKDVSWIDYKPPAWAVALTTPGADGMLFFDELNQGSRQVLNTLYKATDANYKALGSRKMAKDVVVIATGNLGQEFGSEPLPKALTNRFHAGILVLKPEEWLEYAREIDSKTKRQRVEDSIIKFVEAAPQEHFYIMPTGESDQFPTGRQLVKLSNEIRDIKEEHRVMQKNKQKPKWPLFYEIGVAAGGLCGTEWAGKFINFLKYYKEFNFKSLVANVKSLKDQTDISYLLALQNYIMSMLRPVLGRMVKTQGKALDGDDLEIFEGVVKIINNVSDEFKAQFFSRVMHNISQDEKRVYAKYLVDGQYNPEDKKEFREKSLRYIKQIMSGID